MRADFEHYFRDAEDSLRRNNPFAGVEEIEAAFDFPPNWRADARFYLRGNVTAMVIMPYMTVEGRDRISPNAEFLALLHEDMRRIVFRSGEIAAQRSRDYVSATSVAIALGQLAEDLATTSLQIWGPE